jgi:tRNA A37 methylthiotransferase MiaB
MSMKIYICALNSCGMRNAVIQSYRDFLAANGHEVVDTSDDSDVILVWTCGFRRDVRDYSLREIERLVERGRGEVVVAGCLPDIDRQLLAEHFHGRIVPWREHEGAIERLFGSGGKKLTDISLVLVKRQLYRDEATYRREHPDADVPYIGRYIQLYISEGCQSECTYCSERLAFPPYRSFAEEEIVGQCCAEVARSGRADVVLLGDSVGDYGCDTGSSLPSLIRRLSTEIAGLRLGIQDLNPYHFLRLRDEMVDFLKHGLIVHLQMPYQSASDRILQLMKRPYTRADLDQAFGLLNALRFTEVDSHIIVGFPGETQEDFEQSVAFALRYHPKYMLVNGFLETPSMPAASLPDKVPASVRERRLASARERFTAAGIICNSDESELARERFRRMSGP